MNKLIFALFLLLAVNTLSAQEPTGTWLSTDNQLKNLATTSAYDDGMMIIDFDKNLMGTMATISSEPININRKKTKIKAPGIKGKLKVQILANDVLYLTGKKGIKTTFKKLDLNHKIDMGQEELNEYLIEQQCGQIHNIKGQFTTERFFRDKPKQNSYKKNQFINFTDRDNGYWYFKKINGNVFFIFTLGQDTPENIFQILSIQIRGFNLSQLKNDGRIKDLEILSTCL